jgi:hypothetical protein
MHEACVPDQGLNQLMPRRTSEGPSRLAHVGPLYQLCLEEFVKHYAKAAAQIKKLGDGAAWYYQ